MNCFRADLLAAIFSLTAAGMAFAHGPEPHVKAPPGVKTSPDSHAPGNHGAALGEPGDPKAQSRTILVTMTDDMRFLPDRLAIRRGETIRFVVRNIGKLKHEFVLGTETELLEHAKLMQEFPEMEHDDPNAVSAEPAKSAALLWKFTKPGQFFFGCLVPGHFEGGMKGTIWVNGE